MRRQDVRQSLAEEQYPSREGPALCSIAGGAGHQQAVQQQGAYDNNAYLNAEQATLYEYGYNAGYLDGYKAACRKHGPPRSWSDYSAAASDKSQPTSTFGIAGYARLIALIVLCCVVATAFLVLLAYQLFLSDQGKAAAVSHAGGDVPFPPMAIPKKIPANDSSSSVYQEQAATSLRLRAPRVPEQRRRMQAPMNFKAAPKHSSGHGGVTPESTSRSVRET